MNQIIPIVGKTYIACRPGTEFELDGQMVEFEEERKMITVLPKPAQVIADDGVTEEIIDIPEHLKSEDWLLVENLSTGRSHWLSLKAYTLLQP
jgi:hypothetical protein